MTRRAFLFAAAALALAAATPARADVPVRVRLVKATKTGAAFVDPRLEPLRRQLAEVNYARWEQVAEKDLTLAKGKTEYVSLPSGEPVAITVQDVKPSNVTFEVAIPSYNAVSQAKIEKGQRILQQVTRPTDGVAFFVSVSWQ